MPQSLAYHSPANSLPVECGSIGMPGRIKCQVFCVYAKSGGNLLYFAVNPFFVNPETIVKQFGKTGYFCRKKNRDKTS